jgi:two-component system, OmpR family, KDP operon response regulator KdpE
MTDRAGDPRVLVVEDDDDVLHLIAEVLRGQGCTVYTASNGEHALARLGEVGIDLILLDLTLPDMSGSEFLAIHGRVPTLAPIPVVILSGSDDACAFGERRRMRVLRKPFGAAELIEVVVDKQESPRRDASTWQGPPTGH